MNRLTVGLLTACLVRGTVAVAAPAERAPAPAERVWETHWVCQVICELASQGYVTRGFAWLMRTGVGTVYINRFEFALGVRQLLLDAGWRSAGIPGAPHLTEAWSSDLRAFQQLTEEFAPELAALGVEVTQLRADLLALSDRASARPPELRATSLSQRLSVRPLWQDAPERRPLRPELYRGGYYFEPAARRSLRPLAAPLLLLRDAPADGAPLARRAAP